MPQHRICIIGSGATAVYLLKNLHSFSDKLSITIFEADNEVGKGMPYREDMNADYMLCNAFSREIPPITTTLVNWLESLPQKELNEWELSHHDVSPRAFYPRLLIGEYISAEFKKLCHQLRDSGHAVTVKANDRVIDVKPQADGSTLVVAENECEAMAFDHVIIATGHSWPKQPRINDANLLSPWPYTNVTALEAGNIGILGSSLSAIDVAIALGFTHGTFESDAGKVVWRPHSETSRLQISMVSKMGIIPEADFYYPYPYKPLVVLTEDAVKAEVAKGNDGLLARLFGLLCKELDLADPDYLNSLRCQPGNLEAFSKGYFEYRKSLGARVALKIDFMKTRESIENRETMQARYVLLRAHEVFDIVIRSLNAADWKKFKDTLLPVFTDSYAAVPHLSMARIIALSDADVLSVIAIGEDASFTDTPNGGVEIQTADTTLEYSVLIDARGQSSAPLTELPFPSLIEDLTKEVKHIEAPFKLTFNSARESSIYCLALPQILERYPFNQGLANSAENAEIVVGNLIRARDV
jgi:uncharacterized NAD(P)/FAD-binding protein YdhS